MNKELGVHIRHVRGQGRRFIRFNRGLRERAERVVSAAQDRGENRPYAKAYLGAMDNLFYARREGIDLPEIHAGIAELVIDLTSADGISRMRRLAILNTTTTSS